jgi:hypothetical protein
MFQQSIPRLLPDSDIATYGGQFILIEHRLWPILDRGCIVRVTNFHSQKNHRKRDFWFSKNREKLKKVIELNTSALSHIFLHVFCDFRFLRFLFGTEIQKYWSKNYMMIKGECCIC